MWKKLAIAGLLGASMYLLIHTRFVRPWQSRKSPYRVADVKEEIGDCWSLTIEAARHPGLAFKPGQFVWITIGPTPFSLQQHPFSIASSPREETITFTAKEEGDFTSTWKEIKPGTPVWLEGPFGSFTPQKDSHSFFIMAGIGITPAMSMLRTMRYDKDRRKATLIYANVSRDDITFRDELEDLARVIDLNLIHVLEEPPDEWDGETGRIDQELLEKYLPAEPNTYMYYICGPDPMMDAAEISLRNLGVKWNRVYTERFQIV